MINPPQPITKTFVLEPKKSKVSFVDTEIPPHFYKALHNCAHVNIAYGIWKASGMAEKDPRENFRLMKSQYLRSIHKDFNK